MRKKKDFTPRGSTSHPEQSNFNIVPIRAVGRVHFPVNTSGKRSYDFGKFSGQGIDAILELVQAQVERLLQGEDKCVAVATVVGACNSLTHFLKHLLFVAETEGRCLTAADINEKTLRSFLGYLATSGMQQNGQKKRYDFVKLILVELLRRNKIQLANGFPNNPFPQSNRKMRGPDPYTSSQRKALARALSAATAPFLKSDSSDMTSEQLSMCFLAVALRTGANLTPLLEMGVDDIKLHVKPGMKLLALRKRRGKQLRAIPLHSPSEHALSAVLPSTSRLLEHVIRRSDVLRRDAPQELRESVWLFVSNAQRNRGEIKQLTPATLRVAAAKLAVDYGLREHDGRPLAVNVPRMRKTFVNRVYDITEGNVLVTARAAGHTPRVSATHYLVPDREAEKNWKFFGEAMAQDLARTDAPMLETTPCGKCRDTRGGEYAPKNGALCTSYLNCFRCRSYVVTASDLHKIFSLYWMVVRERESLPKSQWKRIYAHVIRAIDTDIVSAGISAGIFDKTFAMKERARAKTAPHPFWRFHERG